MLLPGGIVCVLDPGVYLGGTLKQDEASSKAAEPLPVLVCAYCIPGAGGRLGWEGGNGREMFGLCGVTQGTAC